MAGIHFFITIFSLLIKPFSNRIRLGEGGLIVFNISHSIACHKSVKLVLIETIISFCVLCVLYGYNDYTDAEKDKLNPKKDINFINLVLDHRKLFFGLIIGVNLLTISAALLFLSKLTAIFLVILYVINFLYSKKVKSIPLADIIIVSIWGGLYVSLSGSFCWKIFLAAGMMVGIAHFFQIITDMDTDSQTLVRTSAVAFAGMENGLLFTLCLPLIFTIYLITQDLCLTAFGFAPFLFFVFSKKVTFSWYASRLIFLILWLVILNKVYAGI
jgi:4-hydroxybenzoate polyprenyltransferase